MDKVMWNTAFQKLKGGSFAVHYWDGEEVVYGPGEPSFQCAFKTKPSVLSVASDPILVLGEKYMDGEIDFTGDLDAMFKLVHQNPPEAGLGGKVLSAAGKGLKQLKRSSIQKDNIKAHYDLGNDFFALWLDETMSYSSAYFHHEDDNLREAQLQKIDLVLRKMRLRPGQKLLDIGCGWGWLILRAAEKYGVEALGITLSQEQFSRTEDRIAGAGLKGRVEVRLVNYLDLDEARESFDAVVSIGMFEHVGQAFFGEYLAKVTALLKPGGLSMLHTLTSQTETETNSWVKKYIFPGGYIPSLREVVGLLPDYDLRVLQVESLRPHYVRTLERWYENFSSPEVRAKVLAMFDERFIRMWSLYLLGAASSLRNGSLDVHQLVLSRGVNNNLPLTLADIYCPADEGN